MTDVFKIVNWFRVVSNAQMRQFDADELSQMKVMKLLYYVQGTSLAVYQERAFCDDIVAWKYGPAVEAVHRKYTGKAGIVGTLRASDLADYKELNESPHLKRVLRAVWETYGDMSAIQLMKLTHTESPWQQTAQSKAIDLKVLQNFFADEIIEK